MQSTPLNTAVACQGSFVERQLDYRSKARGDNVRFYDSNGLGLATEDLDNDGDLDLVLANLAGDSAIFWNEGNFIFRKELLASNEARAVNIVDVNADGWLDIVFSHSLGAISFWRNDSKAGFIRENLKGVTTPAYSLAWADLDSDGDLDLVTASYDALLELEQKSSFLFSSGAGVMVFENSGQGFKGQRLSRQAQALALLLFDINDDGRLDIVVGNDFEMPDQLWLNTEAGWLALRWPFARLSGLTTASRVTVHFWWNVGELTLLLLAAFSPLKNLFNPLAIKPNPLKQKGSP